MNQNIKRSAKEVIRIIWRAKTKTKLNSLLENLKNEKKKNIQPQF